MPFLLLALLLVSLAACGGDLPVRKEPLDPIVPSPIARDGNAPFEDRVRSIYNFKPSRISGKDQDLKAGEMDAIWSSVDRNPKALLPLLRKELQRPDQNPFFRFDGAQLLLQHSKEPGDLQLAADAMGQADLEDVDRMSYFRAAHRVAVGGANVWGCVDRILSDKAFKVFIPQHSLTLDQKSVVISCLLPMKEEHYVSALAARLMREQEPTAVKSMLAGLSMAVTPEAQTALGDFARTTRESSFRKLAEPLIRLPSKKDLPGKAEGTREQLFVFLKDLVARRYDNPAYSFDRFRKGAPHLVRKEDLPKIRELRRTHASRVSDEAIEELTYLTTLMKVSLASED